MESSEIGSYFEEHGEELMEMLKRKEQGETVNPTGEMGQFFQEHKREITEMMIKKSFQDGVITEGKAASYIKKMQEKGQSFQDIAERLGITPYTYYSDFSELDQVQTELTEECKVNLDEGIVSEFFNNGEKISNIDGVSSKFYQDSEKSMLEYKKMYDLFIHKQDDAILHALNRSSLVTIHAVDANILTKELEQIKGRTTIEKIKDIFAGQARAKKERATEIERALTIITKKIEMDKEERDNPSMPQGELTPEQVVVNLYKARSAIERESESDTMGVDRYSEMIEYMKEHYDVDYKKVNEMINADKSQLPQVAGKGARITERQKMDYFLQHQGYVKETDLSGAEDRKRNFDFQPVDPFKAWTVGKINTIKRRITEIQKIGTMLRTGEEIDSEKQPKEDKMKGTGTGFNIVR